MAKINNVILITLVVITALILVSQINLVSGWNTQIFNNSQRNETFTLNNAINFTRYLSVPNVSVTTATINISGELSNRTCLQENATSNFPGDGYCKKNFTQGSYYFLTISSHRNLVVSYNKPAQNFSGATWTIAAGYNNGLPRYWYNVTIPATCLNVTYNNVTVMVDLYYKQFFGWCWANGWNQIISNTYGSGGSLSFGGGNDIYLYDGNYTTNGATYEVNGGPYYLSGTGYTNGGLFEEAMYWIVPTENVTLSVNNSNVWNSTGLFTTNVKTNNFASTINSYLSTCTFVNGFCAVPLIFRTDTAGLIKYLDLNFYAIENFTGYTGTYANVTFNQKVNSTANLLSVINSSRNYIFVNTTIYPEFNVPANITFSGMPKNFKRPIIYRDTSICIGCINYTSLNDEIVTFYVPGFSSYTIGEQYAQNMQYYYSFNNFTTDTYDANNLVSNNLVTYLYDYCYQESANESTDCGGLNTGTYDTSVSSYYYVNYTKPENASSAIWQVKHGNNSQAIPYNATIPTECLKSTVSLRFNFYLAGGWSGAYGECQNSTGSWKLVTNNINMTYSTPLTHSSVSASRVYDGDWDTQAGHITTTWETTTGNSIPLSNVLYEEAILWGMPNNNTANNYTGSGINYLYGGVGNARMANLTSVYLASTNVVPILGNASRSVNFWAKVIDTSVNTTFIEFGSRTDNNLFGIYATTSGWKISGGNSSNEATFGTINSNWHMHSILYNGTDTDWYIDGIKSYTYPHVFNTTSSKFFVGRNYSINGTIPQLVIDELGVWNRTLNGSEVTAFYNNQLIWIPREIILANQTEPKIYEIGPALSRWHYKINVYGLNSSATVTHIAVPIQYGMSSNYNDVILVNPNTNRTLTYFFDGYNATSLFYRARTNGLTSISVYYHGPNATSYNSSYTDVYANYSFLDYAYNIWPFANSGTDIKDNNTLTGLAGNYQIGKYGVAYNPNNQYIMVYNPFLTHPSINTTNVSFSFWIREVSPNSFGGSGSCLYVFYNSWIYICLANSGEKLYLGGYGNTPQNFSDLKYHHIIFSETKINSTTGRWDYYFDGALNLTWYYNGYDTGNSLTFFGSTSGYRITSGRAYIDEMMILKGEINQTQVDELYSGTDTPLLTYSPIEQVSSFIPVDLNVTPILSQGGNHTVTFTANFSDKVELANATLTITKNRDAACYQETANASTTTDGSCDLNYTGTYSCDGACSAAIDGNWGTAWQAASQVSFAENNLYINYTIPPIPLTNVTWAVYGFDSGAGKYTNMTLPSDCINLTRGNINLRVQVFSMPTPKTKNYTCWSDTSSGWKQLYYTSSSFNGERYVYEEAIYWNSDILVNNTSVNLVGYVSRIISVPVGLLDGVYRFFWSVIGLSGALFSEDSKTDNQFKLYADAPTVEFVSPTVQNGTFQNVPIAQIGVFTNYTSGDDKTINITIKLYNKLGSLLNTSSGLITAPDTYYTNLSFTGNDGYYYYVANATSAYGVSNFTLSSFYLDTAGPTIEVNSPSVISGAVTTIFDINLSEINQSGVNNATFTIINDTDTINVSFFSFNSVNFTNINIPVSLVDGNYNWSVEAYDNLSNYNRIDRTLLVSHAPPTINFISPTPESNTTATEHPITIATNVSYNTEYLRIYIWNDSGILNTTSVYLPSQFNYLNFTLLSNGNYSFNASASNGEYSTWTENRNFALDIEHPVVNNTDYILNLTYSNVSYINFTFDAYDSSGLDNATMLINSDPILLTYVFPPNVANATVPFNVTLPNGQHAWQITVYDINGNPTTFNGSIMINVTLPELQYYFPPDGSYNILPLNITANIFSPENNLTNGTLSYTNGTLTQVFFDYGGAQNNVTLITAPIDGDYVWWTNVIDIANNNFFTQNYSFILDTQYPIVSSSASGLNTSSVNVTIITTITEAHPISIDYSITGPSGYSNNAAYNLTGQTGTFLNNISLYSLVQGRYYYTTNVTDAGGLSTITNNQFTIDYSAPNIITNYPAYYSSWNPWTPGLISYYPFSEGYGNTTADSVDNNTAYLSSKMVVAPGSIDLSLTGSDSVTAVNQTLGFVFYPLRDMTLTGGTVCSSGAQPTNVMIRDAAGQIIAVSNLTSFTATFDINLTAGEKYYYEANYSMGGVQSICTNENNPWGVYGGIINVTNSSSKGLDGNLGNYFVYSVNGLTYNLLNEGWVPGKIGNGSYFNGNDTYAEINNFLSPMNETFSIGVWIYPNSIIASHRVIEKGQNSDWRLVTIDTSSVSFRNDSNLDSVDIPLSAGTWTYIVISYNGTTACGYKNGQFVMCDTFPISDSSDTITIGNYGGDKSYGWNGTIDEIGLWNRTLTAEEIQVLYNNAAGRQYPQLDNNTVPNATTNTRVVNFTANLTSGPSGLQNATLLIVQADGLCYQETADNASVGNASDCGALSGGWYSSSDLWNDGNWDSYSHGGGDFAYEKPLYATNATFHYRVGSGYSPPLYYADSNVTIPDSCWNYNATHINMRITASSILPNYFNDVYCYDGSWHLLAHGASFDSVENHIYEESMYWGMDIEINKTTIDLGGLIQTTVAIPVSLLDGAYRWLWSIYSFAGNLFQTPYGDIDQLATTPTIYFVYPDNGTYFSNSTIDFQIYTDELAKNLTFSIYGPTPIAVWNNLSIGLKSYWDFNNVTSSVSDIYTGVYNLTAYNNSVAVPGLINNSMNFSVAQQQYTFNNFDFNLTSGNFTWNVWIYDRGNGGTGVNSIMYRTGLPNLNGWEMDMNSGTGINTLFTGNGGSGYNPTISTSYSLNTWTMWTIMSNSSGVNWYKDGVYIGTALNSPLMPAADLVISRDRATPLSGYMNEMVDEMGVWNRSLNQTEISSLYNSGAGLGFSSPWIYTTTITPINGTNNITIILPVDGYYYYNANATGESLLVTDTGIKQLNLDSVNPIITLLNPPTTNLTIFSQTTNTFNASLTDENSGLLNATFNIDGTDYVSSYPLGTLSTILSNTIGLDDDTYPWSIVVYDRAGNKANYSGTLAVDTNASIIFDQENPYVPRNGQNLSTHLIQMQVRIYDTTPDHVTYNVWNTTWINTTTISLLNQTVNGSYQPFPPGSSFYNWLNVSVYSDGIYYFNATVTDSANNTGSTETRQVTLDITNPNITIWSPNNRSDIPSDVYIELYQEYANQSNAPLGDVDYWIYENYTKPIGALDNSTWKVIFSYPLPSHNATIVQLNLTIPQSCWNAYQDKLVFRLTSKFTGLGGATTYFWYECNNGTGFQRIYDNSSSFGGTCEQYVTADSTGGVPLDGIWPTDVTSSGKWASFRDISPLDPDRGWGGLRCINGPTYYQGLGEDAMNWNAPILVFGIVNTSYVSNNSVNFNATITDNLGIQNATLTVTGTTNYTNTTIFSPNTITTTIAIPLSLIDGMYTWFWAAYDWAANLFATQNYQTVVDTNAPSINYLLWPTKANGYNSSARNFSIGVEVYENNPLSITYRISNPTFSWSNSTTYSLVNQTGTYPLAYMHGSANTTWLTSGSWSGYPGTEKLFNDDWSFTSSGGMMASFSGVTVYVNYTMPPAAATADSARWIFWGPIGYGTGYPGQNMTTPVPQYCLDYARNNSNVLRLRFDTGQGPNGGSSIYTYCYNGTWNTLYTNNGRQYMPETNTWGAFAEIVIYFDKTVNQTFPAGTFFQSFENFTVPMDGTYYYNVSVTDAVGFTNYSSTRTITIDTTNPTFRLINPSTTAYNLTSFYTTQTNNFTQYVSDVDGLSPTQTAGLATVVFRINNTDYTTTFSGTVLNATIGNVITLVDGNYPWTLNITDKVGNKNSTSGVIQIDSTYPIINSVYPPSGNYYPNWTVPFRVNISESNPSYVIYSIWNSTWNNITTSSLLNKTVQGKYYAHGIPSAGWSSYVSGFWGGYPGPEKLFNDDWNPSPSGGHTQPISGGGVFANYTVPSGSFFGDWIISNNFVLHHINVTADCFNVQPLQLWFDSNYGGNINYYCKNTTTNWKLLYTESAYIYDEMVVNITANLPSPFVINGNGYPPGPSYTTNTITDALNITVPGDGRYYYNISVVDTLGLGTVTTNMNITLDTTNPQITVLSPNNRTDKFLGYGLTIYQENADWVNWSSTGDPWVYVNYTKPTNITENLTGAVWRFGFKESRPDEAWDLNLTIPNSCWNANPNYIALRWTFIDQQHRAYGDCYNGTGYQSMINYYTSRGSGGNPNADPTAGLDGIWDFSHFAPTACFWYGASGGPNWIGCASLGTYGFTEEAIWWNTSIHGFGIDNQTYYNISTLNFASNNTDNLALNRSILNISGTLDNGASYTNVTTTNLGTALQSIVSIPIALADGIYNWFFSLFDWAGNNVTSTTQQTIVDTKAPVMTFLFPTTQTFNYTFVVRNASIELKPKTWTYQENGNGFYAADSSEYAYVNYTRPAGTLSAKWQAAWSIGNSSASNGYPVTNYVVNFTIPNDCFTNNIQLRFKYARIVFPNDWQIKYDCWNVTSSSWSSLYQQNINTALFSNLLISAGFNTKDDLNDTKWSYADGGGASYLYYNAGSPFRYQRSYINGIPPTGQTQLGFWEEAMWWEGYFQNETAYLEFSTNNGTSYTNYGLVNAALLLLYANSTEGNNHWIVRATDLAQNQNSTRVDFFVDSISPTISFINYTEPSDVKNNIPYITFNITAFDTNLRRITFNIYNLTGLVRTTNISVITNATTIWGGSLNNLTNGDYWFNATACDILNNCNSTETRVKHLDLIPPNISFVNPTVATNTNLSAPYDMTAIWANLSMFENFPENMSIYLNSSWTTATARNITRFFNSSITLNTTQYLFTNWTSLPDGIYNLTGEAVDAVNNIARITNTIYITGNAPVMTYAYPTPLTGGITSIDIPINITSVDLNTMKITMNFWYPNGTLIATYNSSPYQYNLYHLFTGLPNGGYWFNATSYDIYNHTTNLPNKFVQKEYGPGNTTICKELLYPGTYTLLNNLNATTTSSAACFDVKTSNVVVDCQGHSITLTNGTTVFRSNQGGLTVKNCVMDTTGTAIDISGGSATLTNDTITSDVAGIRVTGGSVTATSCSIDGLYGVYVNGTGSVSISSSTIHDNTYGIFLTGSPSASLNGITFTNNVYAIYHNYTKTFPGGSSGSQVWGPSGAGNYNSLTFTGSGTDLIDLVGSNYNKFTGLTGSTGADIRFVNSSNNRVTTCTLTGGTAVVLTNNSTANTFLDCKYDSESVDSSSVLIRSWTTTITTRDNDGSPVGGTTVHINDGSNSTVYTNPAGTVVTPVNQYINNGTVTVFNPYEIFGVLTDYGNSVFTDTQITTVNDQTQVDLTFSQRLRSTLLSRQVGLILMAMILLIGLAASTGFFIVKMRNGESVADIWKYFIIMMIWNTIFLVLFLVLGRYVMQFFYPG